MDKGEQRVFLLTNPNRVSYASSGKRDKVGSISDRLVASERGKG